MTAPEGRGGRRRELPSVVRGRLVVLDDHGTQDIESKIDEMKHKAEEIRNEERRAAEAMKARTMSNSEKVKLFRQGFLVPANRENFRDAVKILKGETN